MLTDEKLRPRGRPATARVGPQNGPVPAGRRVPYRVMLDGVQLANLRRIKERTGESVQPLIRRAIDAVIANYNLA